MFTVSGLAAEGMFLKIAKITKLDQHTVSDIITMRDLGVIVSNCGNVSQQCSTVAAKARRLIGLMLRTFNSRNRNVILPMYKFIIRPVVEYATAVWNPCLLKDIAEVERVCTRAFSDS